MKGGKDLGYKDCLGTFYVAEGLGLVGSERTSLLGAMIDDTVSELK